MTTIILAALLAAPAAASDQPALGQAQLERLVKDVSEKGITQVPGPELSAALGLPKSAEPYAIKYLMRRGPDQDGIEREIGVSKQTGDYLLVTTTKARIYYFRMDAKRMLAGWASYKRRGEMRPLEAIDADLLFKRDLAYWAEVADKN